MRLELKTQLVPTLTQTLQVMLNPKMLHMLAILNLSYIELIEKIDQEVESNVMLEVEQKDKLLEYIKYVSGGRPAKKEVLAEELPGIETLGDTSLTLENHLMNQLGLEDLTPLQKRVGEYLIKSLDERGFLPDYDRVKAAIQKELEVGLKEIDSLLKIIQTFEPEGVGARDFKECLLIQVREYNFENLELKKVLGKVISKYLDDLGEQKFEKIAQKLKISKEGVAAIAQFIKQNLNPHPGGAFSKKLPNVIPSFVIQKREEEYEVINLEKSYGPTLKISAHYIKLLKDPKTDEKTLEFLKEKLKAAKVLVEHILKREDSLERILQIIKESQVPFLEKGVLYLAPLEQKEIAADLGVHPSTISRAIADKFVQTPQGLLTLRYLCPRQYRGYPAERIKAIISAIIEKEDKRRPLSDEEIKGQLQKEGIKIQRRTVAAYRKQLKISPSKYRMVPK